MQQGRGAEVTRRQGAGRVQAGCRQGAGCRAARTGWPRSAASRIQPRAQAALGRAESVPRQWCLRRACGGHAARANAHARARAHAHAHAHSAACGVRAAYMPRAKSCSGSARCSAAAVSHLGAGEAQDSALRAYGAGGWYRARAGARARARAGAGARAGARVRHRSAAASSPRRSQTSAMLSSAR